MVLPPSWCMGAYGHTATGEAGVTRTAIGAHDTVVPAAPRASMAGRVWTAGVTLMAADGARARKRGRPDGRGHVALVARVRRLATRARSQAARGHPSQAQEPPRHVARAVEARQHERARAALCRPPRCCGCAQWRYCGCARCCN
jgi:hypothetical protein